MQIKPAPAACYRRPRVDETDHPVAVERSAFSTRWKSFAAKG